MPPNQVTLWNRLRTFCHSIGTTLLRLSGLARLGLVVGGALLLVTAGYWAFNLSQASAIDSAYASFRVPQLASVEDKAAAERVLIYELEWLTETEAGGEWFGPWLARNWQAPAHEQLLDLLQTIEASENAAVRATNMQSLATGRREWHVVPPLTMTASSPTGRLIWDAQLELERGMVRAALGRREDGSGVGALGLALSSALADAMHAELRGVRRFNGVVQWLTLWISAALALLLLDRARLVARSRGASHPGRHADVWGDPLLAAVLDETRSDSPGERHVRLKGHLDRGPYAFFGAVIGFLPTLGFIGTILGMGESLLRADTLMTATDRQEAIHSMTEQLGFAFDTTLVALVCAALLAGLVATLGYFELREHCRVAELHGGSASP